MVLLANKAYLRKLRVISNTQDKLALRLRLDRTLSGINFQPSGLPHSAMLFIRRLSDPLPGAFDTRSFSSGKIFEWERAVEERISRFLGQAARPALAATYSDTECVMFADKAEMFACLAQDWVERRIASRWWWKSLLLETENARATIISLWTSQAAYIPGALQHLANNNSAEAFVSKLYAHEAEKLLQSVLQCFNLVELRSALNETITAGPAKEKTNEVGQSRFQLIERFSASLSDNAKGTSIANKSLAPWQEWVSDCKSFDWQFERQAFLGIALMIQRAPTVVRSKQFARSVKSWRQSVALVTKGKEQTVNTIVQIQKEETMRRQEVSQSLSVEKASQTESCDEQGENADRRRKTRFSFSGQIKTDALNDAGSKKDSLIQDSKARSRENRNRVIEFSQEDGSIEKKVSTACSSGRAMAGNNYPPATAGGTDTAFPTNKPEAQDKETLNKKSFSDKQEFVPLVETQLHTELGGVFYLLNFGLFLHLYEDFTQEPSANLQLNVWDFIALLGQRLLKERNESDPLWSLLAHLAGRQKDEEADSEFTDPFEWRILVVWLKTFESTESWLWSVIENRLLVLHPIGFVVIDISRNSQSVDHQLECELEPYKDFFSKLVPGNEEDFAKYRRKREEKALQFWFERFFSYALVRLQRALGATDITSLTKLLLGKRAQVTVTTTHVDVVFSLRDLSVEIRLSGLDRNPSWIPAAGRIISFYYE